MNSFSLDSETIQKAISIALAEDIGTGDVTTLSLIPAEARAEAVMKARQPLSVAGLDLAAEAYRQIDPSTEITYCCADGDQLNRGDILLHLIGSARAILTAERVSLNFIQRLSGIATLSRQFTDKIAGTKAKLLDTRKTTPNMRAIQRARAAYPNLKVEVEADTLEQVSQAADAGADIILLDNMTNEMMSQAVQIVQGRSLLEASGGVTLQTVRGKAETGVDFISVGALTHSVPAVDIGLDFI